ncbi:MAG TPA: aspartyl protease family protein [Phycisphaerae bacterium]|nr:aspartyl protease family protein [Phycisphaerae bacterium]
MVARLICCLIGSFAFTANARADYVLVLKHRAGKFSVEKASLKAGQPLVLDCHAGGDVVDVIFPVGIGVSGSVAQAGRTITVRSGPKGIEVVDRAGDGREYHRPVRTPAQLRDESIRVSVCDGSGATAAFRVEGYERIVDDGTGPIVDMFQGKVPLHPGDFVICTDTAHADSGAPVRGRISVEYDRYLFAEAKIGDTSRLCVIDLGAAETVVAKSALPAGVTIQESTMAQYSPAGKQLLKYEPGGATGPVQSVLGHAVINSLHVGTVDFGDVDVTVLKQLPQLAGRPVEGILGMDLLRRAGLLHLRFDDDRSVTVTMGQAPQLKTRASTPFSLASAHVFIRSHLGDRDVFWLVDTGSPISIVPKSFEKQFNLKAVRTSDAVGGLDAGKVAARTALLPTLTLGRTNLDGLPALITDLPVLAPFQSHNQAVGLLGNSALSRLAAVEIDFRSFQIQFAKR